jgi:hypothetical protein
VTVSDLEKSVAHYRKIFGQEQSREKNRVWFRVSSSRLALEQAGSGEKPKFARYCVKVAGFNRSSAVEKLKKLGIETEPGTEKGSLRFHDLHNLPVEIVAG